MKIKTILLTMGAALMAQSAQAAVMTVSDGTNDWFVIDSSTIDANFSTSGTWLATGAADPGDWGGDSIFDLGAGGATGEFATWSYTGLTDGTYAVAVSYSFTANRPTNAPYSINGGTAITVNQETAAAGSPTLNDGANNVLFDTLSSSVTVTGGTLSVVLNDVDNSSGNTNFTIADAVAIRLVTPVPEPSSSALLAGGLAALMIRRRR